MPPTTRTVSSVPFLTPYRMSETVPESCTTNETAVSFGAVETFHSAQDSTAYQSFEGLFIMLADDHAIVVHERLGLVDPVWDRAHGGAHQAFALVEDEPD